MVRRLHPSITLVSHVAAIGALAASGLASCASAASLDANPSNYQALLRTLKPGDTLTLAPGHYPGLNLSSLNGTPDQWITITGSSPEPSVIDGARERNTVEITECSYLAIENLVVDSRGIPGAFGISARGKEYNHTHHIRLEGNTLTGQNGGQQTDGISTKTPTWGWIIRFNKIIGAGTGLYLGDSDGNQPFVGGIIENNFIQDTLGYNMEIKDQRSLPIVPGMPLTPTSTIIRNNVFIKNDRSSPDGDRPNLLVGSFPDTGPGSDNLYEIYGNYFVHNHREALFQGSGRVSLHDNVFIDGPYAYAAVVLRKQNAPLKLAMIYNNTVYTPGDGIQVGTATNGGIVVGNLVFAATKGIAAPSALVSDNLLAAMEDAAKYVRAPSADPAEADFYPLRGKCQGAPLDLSMFQSDADYTLDFNGLPKTQARGAIVFRGAYAGEADNPGWKLAATLKSPAPPLPKKPRLAWVEVTRNGAAATLTLTGANFAPGAEVHVSGSGIEVTAAEVQSPTRIQASVKMNAAAPATARQITVTTPMGASNPLKFRASPAREK